MTPLDGLIPVGGQNRRMGCDKAWLKMGMEQIEMREHLHRLLTMLLGRCVFSINKSQRQDPYYGDKICAIDLAENKGPMGGIWTAMQCFSGVSFLTVACDMPLVNAPLLQGLIAQRNEEGVFYEVNSRIEPLCGIYESALFDRIDSALQNGVLSLRKLLEQSRIKCVAIGSTEPFVNINTQEDLIRFRGGNHKQENVL